MRAAARGGRRRDRRLGLGRRRRVAERDRERVVDLRHVPDVELVADLLGDVERVLLVALGQEHDLDAGAVRGEHLLLDAADRQRVAAQVDLAGDRDVVADRALA